VGKTTLALRLAQALNCEAPEPPCGQCKSCRRIQNGLHLDVRTIQLLAEGDDGEDGDRPRTGTKNIRLKQVNDLLHEVALTRQEGRYKVYTILDAENLQIDAANRLLKVLEEPPAHVVLLLTAADANILLPTIVSRCQLIRLQPVPVESVASHLRERLGLEAGRAEVLARLFGLVEAGLGDRFDLAAKMAGEFGRERASVYRALDLWTIWWRDVLLVQVGAEEIVANFDRLETLRAQARAWTPNIVRDYLARIAAARTQLEQNVNPRLALESLLLGIPQARAS
jgi:DNA polymerase-3 subunit delta'